MAAIRTSERSATLSANEESSASTFVLRRKKKKTMRENVAPSRKKVEFCHVTYVPFLDLYRPVVKVP